MFQDVNGEYFGFDRQNHVAAGFNYYTDMSLWDTFRTVHPLYNLIARPEQRDMIVSLVKMAEQGGYLPRWPSGGGYTGSMFGSPADMMITESYLKGIRDFDVETAYRFMRKTSLAPVPPNSPFSGRVGVEHYLTHEYCPSDLMKKSVASTIEYCYADQSIARLAEALGHKDDAILFKQHGRFYVNLWNPETQFFQGRDSQKRFQDDLKPDMLTYVDIGGKYTHAPKNGTLGAIAAFGVGHVLYIIAIVGILRKHSRLSSPKTLACILFWQLVGLFSWYQIVFHAEKNETLIWPALGYCLLLAGTTGVASAVAIHRQRTWPLALGAALFLLSDLILAIGIFRGSFPFRSEAVWLTYGPGQMLMVTSSWLVDRETPDKLPIATPASELIT